MNLSDRELMASAGNEAEILRRYRKSVLEMVTGWVGDADLAEIITDIAFERAFATAGEFDAAKEWLLVWIFCRVHGLCQRWQSPASAARTQIYADLRAADLSANHSELKPLLKPIMRTLLLENDTMIAIAKRLVEAGQDVWEAGEFAARKSMNLSLRSDNVNELYAAINRCDDASELLSLWKYVVAASSEYEFQDNTDYWNAA